MAETGEIACKLLENEKAATYDMYNDYRERAAKIPPHRILAVNRGEKAECLKVNIEVDEPAFVSAVQSLYVKADNESGKIVAAAAEDAFYRLIYPSVEREVRSELSEKAREQAI